jgi:hypothetical protein
MREWPTYLSRNIDMNINAHRGGEREEDGGSLKDFEN